MASEAKKMPVSGQERQSSGVRAPEARHPMDNLRKQIDKLFEEFGLGMPSPFGRRALDVEPFWRREMIGQSMPAVDISEKSKSFEISAELPGMDEKDIEISLSNGNLVIKGEKRDQSEEKAKDYYLSERHYGAFERIFNLPKGVDAEKIDAKFRQGVLTITLPKRPEAINPDKRIPIKGA